MSNYLKAYKYRIYPNLEQREYLVKTFGCTRFIYNQMLADRIKSYEENKDLDIKAIKYPTPAQYKKEYEWLKEVDSLALANAQMNLDKAYKNFFRDKSVGFPKFKSKKTNRFSYTTNNQNGTIYIDNGYIKIPKLKSKIKIVLHRQFKGLIKSATISKTPSNQYYISILVDTENIQLPKNDNKIGIDLGLKEFTICSNGDRFDNPQNLRKSEKKLSKLQKDLSRKQKGSNNRYKASWNSREIIIAPSNYASSQLCSECGYKNSDVKNLALRNWTCPECGVNHDRDINASINLLKLAM